MEKSISNKTLILLIGFALIIMFATWGMGWITFFCFLVIGYCILMMWLNKACQRETQFVTTLPIDVVEQVARRQFNGLAWKFTEGSGDLNWKQRLSGLTISMNIDEDPNSDTNLLITIFMSRWSTRYGIVSGSEQVVRQQRRIVKKLQAIQDETLSEPKIVDRSMPPTPPPEDQDPPSPTPPSVSNGEGSQEAHHAPVNSSAHTTPQRILQQTANSSPFDPGTEMRLVESFPGTEPVASHMLAAIKNAESTFTLSGKCSPQEILDEFLRLMPICQQSVIHNSGTGMMFGDSTLTWCVLTDGNMSMVLYPAARGQTSENSRAEEVFDLASANLRQCGSRYYHAVLTHGEGRTGETFWIERATFVPLQWLNPWRKDFEKYDPTTFSNDHREIMSSITNTVMPIYESDDSEDLKQWIPQITQLCTKITQEDPRTLNFVMDLRSTSIRAALADWANPQNSLPMSELGWTQLGDSLEASFPGVDLVRTNE